MRNTFLVFNDPKNHESGLRVATLAEWDQILRANRGVSQEQRRYFICDCFEDCGELDRMYIETSKEEFDMTNSKHSERSCWPTRKRQTLLIILAFIPRTMCSSWRRMTAGITSRTIPSLIKSSPTLTTPSAIWRRIIPR